MKDRLGGILLVFLLLNACKSQPEPVKTDIAPVDTIVSSIPPFQTKEPERYQATRTVTINTGDGKTLVTKASIARDGDRRRHESETLSKRVAYLNLPEGRYVLLPDEKVYANLTIETKPRLSEDQEITPEHLLHDDVGTTSYQNLGKEVAAGRSSIKYRTVVNSSAAGSVSHSETFIWIDEALGMPIKSQTTSTEGTRITMELSNVSLDVDQNLFQIPNDYKRISFGELRKRLATTE